MTPIEMIAEWRKGCSIAGPACGQTDSPANCFECTEALIDALEARLRRGEAGEVERAREYVASSMHDRDRSWGDLVRAGERDDCPEMRMVIKAMRAERQIEAQPTGPAIGPMTFHRIGTMASPHVMSARSLRDYLTAVIAVAEATAESPEPSIEMAGGFFVTFTTTREAPQP